MTMSSTTSIPFTTAEAIAIAVHGSLPGLLQSMGTFREVAKEAVLQDIVEIGAVCRANHTENGGPVTISPMGDSFMVENATSTMLSGLESVGFQVRSAGEVAVVKRKKKPASSKKKKDGKKPSPTTQVGDLNHLESPAVMRQILKLWKDSVQSESYANFTRFVHEIDDVIEKYRVESGHEPASSKQDDDEGEEKPISQKAEDREGVVASVDENRLTSSSLFYSPSELGLIQVIVEPPHTD